MQKALITRSLLVLVIILFISKPEYANTVTSTAQGGWWNHESTWIGGVIPNDNDDVVINGPVYVYLAPEIICNSLSINENISLTIIPPPTVIGELKIVEKLKNDGTIINTGSTNILLYGDFENNGNIDPSISLYLTSSFIQYIYGSSPITLQYIWAQNDQDVYIDSNIELKLKTMSSPSRSFNLIIPEGVTVSFSKIEESEYGSIYANIYGGGTISSDSTFYFLHSLTNEIPTFSNIVLNGHINGGIVGAFTAHIGENVRLTPTAVLKGSFIFLEDFIHSQGAFEAGLLKFHKNLTNESLLNAEYIIFSGSGDSVFISGDSIISATTILTEKDIIINGSTHLACRVFEPDSNLIIVEEGNSLSLSKPSSSPVDGQMIGGNISGGGLVSSDTTFLFTNGTTFRNITLDNTIQIIDAIFEENVILNGTINSGTISGYLKINENFINNGSIAFNNSNFPPPFFIDIKKNVVNKGLWDLGPSTIINISGDMHQYIIDSSQFLSDVHLISDITGINYQWYLNEQIIQGATDSVLIRNIQNNDHLGVYKCMVDTVISREIHLIRPYTTTNLNGYIVCGITGKPIDSALVEIANLKCYTDTQGYYEFLDIPTPTFHSAFIAEPRVGVAPLKVQFTDQSSDSHYSFKVRASKYSAYENNLLTLESGLTHTNNIELYPGFSYKDQSMSAETIYKHQCKYLSSYDSAISWLWKINLDTTYIRNPEYTFEFPFEYYTALYVRNTNNYLFVDSKFNYIISANPDDYYLTSEDFDASLFPPNKFWRNINFNESSWFLDNMEGYSFNDIFENNLYSAYCIGSETAQNEWLISPKIQLENDTTIIEFFCGYNSLMTEKAQVKLKISYDNCISWDEIWVSENDFSGWKWRKESIKIANPENCTEANLAWQVYGENDNIVAIDRVRINPEINGNINVMSSESNLLEITPNPFSDKTKFVFQKPCAEDFSLCLYDISGNIIFDMGQINKGTESISWDSSNIQSGIYFYVLMHNNNTLQTGKLVKL